jgi:hypothetical protein
MVNTPNSYYRTSSGGRDPLRIGLVLDSRNQVPAFLARVIQDIQASNFARIESLVVAETTSTISPARLPRKSASDKESRKHRLYDLYLRVDTRMNPGNDPLLLVDASALLSGMEALDAESVDRIRSKSLDVLLHFGHGILRGDILKAARCGVWSYYHADNEFYRGIPSYFWEMREDAPLSGVVLEILAGEPGTGLALCKSLFATERTLSLARNRYTPYWGSVDLIIQKLNELHRFGWDYVLARALPAVSYQGIRASYEIPSNREMISWLGPILLKKTIAYPFRLERVQHWRIALRIGGKPLGEMASPTDVAGFRWIGSPQGHFWADPFPFEHEGKYWVFFEDYSYRTKRGSIACAEISPEGELGTPATCLEHPSRHYSYPHIFRAGGEVFMVPESFDSESVDLYRCNQFPNQWVRMATLLEGKFVDTTIWQHEGLWWLATTTADPHPGAGCLLLFYSESLTGEWQFHPANPISTDIRRNRGAGRVFRDQDRLIRPSQSCAPTYGYSVSFNAITELSRDRYSERPLKTITADHWAGLSGIHTYNQAGKIEFIDGRTPVPLKRVLG